MAYRVRKRTVRYGGWVAGALSGTVKLEPSYVGSHSCTDEVHPGPPYLTGGNLSISKRKFSLGRTTSFSAHDLTTFNSNWDGHLCVLAYIPSPEPIQLSLAGWGAKGWNRAFPLHPIYQLGVSLLELKDLPHMVFQTWSFFGRLFSAVKAGGFNTIGAFFGSFKNLREIPNDYLNLQFGWAPFLQDLAYILSMQDKLRQKLAWLKKKNGKAIRRNFEMDAGGFSEGISRNIVPLTSLSPVLPTMLYSGSVVTSVPLPVQKSYNRRIWFSSKWRFYIPELAGLPRDSIVPLKWALTGIDLDSTILYKVFPWSWLLDWFVSVGAVVQNINLRAKYHVVAEYAYVMCRENFTYRAPGYADVNTGVFQYLGGGIFGWTGVPRRVSGVTDTVYEFRQREEANPYGFGITFASLSAYQWSILVALGLSGGGKRFATRT